VSLRHFHYLGLCGLLLLAAPLAAQSLSTDAPVEWRADASANKQAQKAAEKAAERSQPPPGKGAMADKAGAPPSGGPGGQGGPPPGGMGGGPQGEGPGGKGGPGGPGGPAGAQRAGRASAASMLRPEMAFAAPLEDSLVLYRSRESVLFGSKDSAAVTILPLSGDAVTVAPGVQASVHEDADGVWVEMLTSNAIKVICRYHQEADGSLRVDVVAEGPVPHPGSRFEVTRRYRAAGLR